MRKSWQIKLV